MTKEQIYNKYDFEADFTDKNYAQKGTLATRTATDTTYSVVISKTTQAQSATLLLEITLPGDVNSNIITRLQQGEFDIDQVRITKRPIGY